MASREEKLLDALRSLSPPKAGAGGGVRPEVENAPEPPVRAPQADARADAPPARRRRTIELRLEEVGVFFLVAVMLVVLAFLMGWYGRGLAVPRLARPAARHAPRPPLSIGSPEVLNLGTTARGARKAGAPLELYTILVKRFPLRGDEEAEDHRRFIEERGFTPAWCRSTTKGIELCVGRFESPRHPLLLEWLPKIRGLRETYAPVLIVRIPR